MDSYYIGMEKERVIYLLEQYARKGLTATEEAELGSFLSADQVSLEQVAVLLEEYGNEPFEIDPSELQPLIDKIVSVDMPKKGAVAPVTRLHFLRRGWLRYAAVFILAVGAGTYLWQGLRVRSDVDKEPLTLTVTDVQPGKDGAVLTLADGTTILLDSAQDGVVANEKGTQIKLADGLLTYSTGESDGVVNYNTMSTPNGRQFKLMLPDGSMVWLNAASSITYPTLFSGNDRQVSITGEAYFDVVKNAEKPFKVKVGDHEIVVTGTSFNVNGYGDELYTTVTLVEGSVEVDNKTIEPGEAYVNGKVVKADIEQAVAWKNRVFNFDKMPIDAATRQISRWYDITVEYEHGIPDMKVGGEMGMDLTLSQVLRILSDMQLKYRLEGKKLIIQ